MNQMVKFVVLLTFPWVCLAKTFVLPEGNESVIGEITFVSSKSEDTLLDIARNNDLGLHDIKIANPHVDILLPGDNREILLPTKFVLPYARHEGIILNIPEMRLYYFPKRNGSEPAQIKTYPLGIGREGWMTPYTKTQVVQKREHPTWYPPESIRKEHAAEGDILPKIVGPGPKNPMGDYALKLGLPLYSIHGTNMPFGVGMRVSHGCIRLYPEDIKTLFHEVPVGTPVQIINQPYKVGVSKDRVYLEAHPFLEEDTEQFKENLTSVVSIIVGLTGEQGYDVDWALAKEVISDAKGIPVEIGRLKPATAQFTAGTDQNLESKDNGAGLDLRLETSIINSEL